MRKFLLIAVCFFLSVCSVWPQGPGEIIARQTVVRYTWTGGTTNLVNYVPRLNVNGELDASFVPYLVSTNYLAQFSNNFWQATLALVGGATNQWDYTAGTNYIAGLNYVTAAVTNGILSSANSYTTNYVAQYSNANWQATLDLVGGSTNGWNFTAGTNWVLSQNYVTQSVTNGLLTSATAAATYLGITSNAVSSTFATTALSTTGSVVIPFQMDTRSNRFTGWWVFDTIQATTGIFVTVSNVYSVQSSNIIVNNVYATNVYAETIWGMLNGTSTNADRLQGYTASAFAGTNDVTKTSLTNTIAGVYVETANAGWVDILSKTNSWNNKAETSITNGILSSANSYTDGATNAQGILIGNLFTSNSTMQGQVDGLFEAALLDTGNNTTTGIKVLSFKVSMSNLTERVKAYTEAGVAGVSPSLYSNLKSWVNASKLVSTIAPVSFDAKGLRAIAEVATPNSTEEAANQVAELAWAKSQGYNAALVVWRGESPLALSGIAASLKADGWKVIFAYSPNEGNQFSNTPMQIKEAASLILPYCDAALLGWRASSIPHFQGAMKVYANIVASAYREVSPKIPLIGEWFYSATPENLVFPGKSGTLIVNVGYRGLQSALLSEHLIKANIKEPYIVLVVGANAYYDTIRSIPGYTTAQAVSDKQTIEREMLKGG